MDFKIASRVTFFVVASAIVPKGATAQATAPPSSPVTTLQTTSQATGRRMSMIRRGAVISGLSYLPVAVVGATSGLEADKSLIVPIAGPWIDFTQRPGCPAVGSCTMENADKVLIVADGLFQAIGVLRILGGFFATAHETRAIASSATPYPHRTSSRKALSHPAR